MAQAFGLPQLASLTDPSAAVDQSQLDRQALMAAALRKLSMSPMDTNRQIGGMGYAISPLEVVAKGLQGYQASQLESNSDEQRKSLAEKQAKAYAQALRGVFGDAPDTSMVPAPNGGRPEGVSADAMAAGGFPQPTQQPVAPPVDEDKARRRQAAMSAMLMGNTDLANKIIAGELEQTPKMKEMKAMGIDPRAMGQAELGKLTREGRMAVNPNETVLDAQGKPMFTAPAAPSPQVQELFQTLTAAGIDPKSPAGQQIFQAFAQKQATHQPATSVNVNTEKGYAGHVAQGVATQELAIVDAARLAPDRIQNAQNIKTFLDKNPITGTAAEWRLKFQKAASTAGLIDGKQVATTENLASALASSTLEAIKTSGLGSGQGFTDKDRQFLERAKSGNLETNAQTLRDLADLNERAGRATLARGNDVIKKWQVNPNLAPLSPTAIPAPAAPQASQGPAGVRVVDW